MVKNLSERDGLMPGFLKYSYRNNWKVFSRQVFYHWAVPNLASLEVFVLFCFNSLRISSTGSLNLFFCSFQSVLWEEIQKLILRGSSWKKIWLPTLLKWVDRNLYGPTMCQAWLSTLQIWSHFNPWQCFLRSLSMLPKGSLLRQMLRNWDSNPRPKE